MTNKVFVSLFFLLSFLALVILSQKFLSQNLASISSLKESISLNFEKIQEISDQMEKISEKLEKISTSLEKVNLSIASREKSQNLIQDQISKNQTTSKEEFLQNETFETEIEKSKKEQKLSPKISLSFPKGKEVFPNQEFEVLFLAENFEPKSYDLKISIEYEGKVLSQIFNESENKWQSSNYYLKNIFATSSFSKVFKLKVTSENLFGDVEILVKVRESETEKIIATTSEKIKIKSPIQPLVQSEVSKDQISISQDQSSNSQLTEPKIFLDFPKNVSSQSEFLVSLSLSNLPQGYYDVKIAVQKDSTTLSRICYPAQECSDPSKFKSSYYFLEKIITSPNFTGQFKMVFDPSKFKNLSFPIEATILAKIRNSDTQKLILEFSDNLLISE